MLGVIAGTGFYDWELLENQQEKIIETPYGSATLYLGEIKHNDQVMQAAFLPRHRKNHSIPPHKINYRGNIWALKQIGVNKIIAINAVGSLDAAIPPGEIVLVDDFLDYTWGREHTFYDGSRGDVRHLDVGECYCPQMQQDLIKAGEAAIIKLHTGGVYVATQGPRFESRAEIRAYRSLGATLVGMTGVPEVNLACELGICYASLAVVTNFACGIGESLDGGEITRIMDDNRCNLEKILREYVKTHTDEKSCKCAEIAPFA